MFAFHNDQLGISFKEAHRGLFAELTDGRDAIEVKQSFVSKEALPLGTSCLIPQGDEEIKQHEKYIDKHGWEKLDKLVPWYVPAGCLTFLPLEVPENQQEVMQQLLAIAQVVEELLEAEGVDHDDVRCDEMRVQLNELYDEFVEDYGFIQNAKSYFDGFWSDVRLQVYLLELEGSNGCKADIFRRRLKYPPKQVLGQLFFEDDLDQRVHQAFVWCMGYYGRVLVSEVAEKAGVDEDFAINSLLDQGLVYREWLGAATQEWYEVLGVEPDCTLEELKSARNQLAKQYHTDTGAADDLMMKRINAAFTEGKAELLRKAVAVGG